MNRKILVVAAHPDDEVLGCGGTMKRHSDEGDEVRVVFMTNGVGARGEGEAPGQDSKLRNAARDNALALLGATLADHLAWPDNQMDTVPLLALARSLEPIIASYQPEIIYTHHGADLNLDHRLTLQAVMTAARPQPGSSVREIYSFEIASSTAWQGASMSGQFAPNHYVRIDSQLDVRQAALESYQEEMRPAPHARSLEALEHLARWRGSQVGYTAAEAFCVERILVD